MERITGCETSDTYSYSTTIGEYGEGLRVDIIFTAYKGDANTDIHSIYLDWEYEPDAAPRTDIKESINEWEMKKLRKEIEAQRGQGE